MKIHSDLESCIVHFGEMGSRWGFNRTVGQMFALIVFTEEPLNADQIASALSISRGNVSMGLKELQSWRLIKTQVQAGDRKDYFCANGSIWDLALQVLSERKKREVDPTLSVLRSHLMDSDNPNKSYSNKKAEEIHDLLELLMRWFDDIQSMKPEQLKTLLKLGAGVGKVLEFKDKLLTKS